MTSTPHSIEQRANGQSGELDWRRLFEAVPGPCAVLSRDLRFVAVNDAYLSTLACTREQIIGRNAFEAFPPDEADRDAAEQLRTAFERVFTGSEREEVLQHYAIRDVEGRYVERHWRNVLVPVRSSRGDVEYVLQRADDVTIQVEAERERDVAFEQVQQLLDMAPDAHVTVDTAGRIEHVSSRAVELFGYTERELVGRDVEQLVPDAFIASHRQHRIEYMHAPYRRPMGSGLDLYARTRSGALMPVEISLAPIELADGIHVVASIRDVTERRAVEHEQARSAQERERQVELESEEYRRALRHYQQVVRHRIANPLQVIGGMSRTLLDHPDLDQEVRARMLEEIHVAADKLGHASIFAPEQLDETERALRPRPFSARRSPQFDD